MLTRRADAKPRSGTLLTHDEAKSMTTSATARKTSTAARKTPRKTLGKSPKPDNGRVEFFRAAEAYKAASLARHNYESDASVQWQRYEQDKEDPIHVFYEIENAAEVKLRLAITDLNALSHVSPFLGNGIKYKGSLYGVHVFNVATWTWKDGIAYPSDGEMQLSITPLSSIMDFDGEV
jgi:hypothetical protein